MSDARSSPDFRHSLATISASGTRPRFSTTVKARLVPVSTTMNTPLKAHASYQYPVGIVSVDQLVLSVEI